MSAVQPVSAEISACDQMYEGSKEHYFGVGQSAVACIEAALRALPASPIRRILDLPSGHGTYFIPASTVSGRGNNRLRPRPRRRRFLPPAPGRNPRGFRGAVFHELELGAPLRPHLVRLARHPPRPGSNPGTLHASSTMQRIGGLLVFSMHGLYSLDRLRRRESTYGLPPDRVADVLAACDREGYGYADYPGQADYGVAVASPDWMKARLPETGGVGTRSHVNPRAWNDHHDVYSATRGGGGRTPPGMLQTGERLSARDDRGGNRL